MLSKADAGYVLAAGTDVTCGVCVFLKDAARCAYYGPTVPVSAAHGSCNRWKDGRANTVPYLEPYFSRVQLGYMENSAGFGCRRCDAFKPARRACRRVDRTSAGFTPGRISPDGCCDLWERDPERGGMSDEQLVQILTRPAAALTDMAAQK